MVVPVLVPSSISSDGLNHHHSNHLKSTSIQPTHLANSCYVLCTVQHFMAFFAFAQILFSLSRDVSKIHAIVFKGFTKFESKNKCKHISRRHKFI